LDFPGHPVPFGLWRCRTCGLVFNAPRLSADEIRQQYDGEYYVFNESPARRWARATQLYIEHLLALENRGPGRRLLEVGCAGGELLALARQRGWQVVGVEISPQATRAAVAEHGLDVRAGTLEEHAAHIGRFDVALANDVIEHLASPRPFIRLLHGLLRPGGWVSLETPNWGGFWRRVGGRRWLGLNRFHISLFDAGSLLKLMGDCGFKNCIAGSSTNLAYACWSSRPEITSITKRLPAGLRWRSERLLGRLSPPSFALELRRDPPACLQESLAHIARVEPARAGVSRHLRGDNLTVIGRA
jgi:2-polyprenyl-3-methyl-5-hydroxy-6-metoxy-1,4-benzoquinol methylase